MSDEKMIMADSNEAATKQMREVWVSSDGRIYQDEKTARYAGSTHRMCDCGHPVSQRSYCEQCHQAKRLEKFMAMPVIEWDMTTPIAVFDSESYFFDPDDLILYLEDIELDELDDIQLVKCEPVPVQQVDEEYFNGDQHEDFELPADIQAAVDSLNQVIRDSTPVTFTQGNTAVKLPADWLAKLKEEWLEDED